MYCIVSESGSLYFVLLYFYINIHEIMHLLFVHFTKLYLRVEERHILVLNNKTGLFFLDYLLMPTTKILIQNVVLVNTNIGNEFWLVKLLCSVFQH